jgi:hypothetical protein
LTCSLAVLDPASLGGAMDGIDFVFNLVHSICGRRSFAESDRLDASAGGDQLDPRGPVSPLP